MNKCIFEYNTVEGRCCNKQGGNCIGYDICKEKKIALVSCFTCLFNNKLDDICEENKQYFYAEFGKNCLNYKNEQM
jgi:hypothetical protein